MLTRSVLKAGLIILLLAACHSKKAATSSSDPVDQDQVLAKKYGILLGVEPSSITNLMLYRFIDEWYGVPYQYGGKSKSGVDCSGLTSVLYSTVYDRSLTGSSSSIWKLCDPVDNSKLQEGDLVFFKIGSDKISHVGVYLQNRRFVHASVKKGVMISSLDETYYKNYYYKGGRIK